MRLILISFIFLLECCSNKNDGGEKQSNDSVAIEVPVSEDSNKNSKPFDSSYLVITISADTLSVELSGRSMQLESATNLDQFIEDNKQNITAPRIKIITTQHFSYQNFKSTIDILKKHEYYGFQMIKK